MNGMTIGSVCSGIGTPELAWQGLGWHSAFMAETESFPSAVLAVRFPGVPNAGDFTRIQNGDYEPIDLLVAGTPCQDFSVAGLRAGLDGDRGQLTIEFAKLAGRLRPRWLLWENVPGVLSGDGGWAFGTFLGLLGKLGYGFAYRVLDAQHFGVPQRRRRVFLVGYLGDWRRAAAVLFERESLCGYPPPSREARQDAPRGIAVGPSGGEFTETSCTLDSRAKDGAIRNQLGMLVGCPEVVGTLSDGAHNGGGLTGRTPTPGASSLAHCLTGHMVKGGDPTTDNYVTTGGYFDSAHPLQAGDGRRGYGVEQGSLPEISDVASIRAASGGSSRSYVASNVIQTATAVRRLTPLECERLQGLPDGWTNVPYRGKLAADGPRYKVIGNGMAEAVLRWIGERIERVVQAE